MFIIFFGGEISRVYPLPWGVFTHKSIWTDVTSQKKSSLPGLRPTPQISTSLRLELFKMMSQKYGISMIQKILRVNEHDRTWLWKIIILNRQIIYKWVLFDSYVKSAGVKHSSMDEVIPL